MAMNELNKKKLLMIHNGGLQTKQLYKHICDQLGISLYQIADKPSSGVIDKTAGRLHLKIYEKVLLRYYKTEIDKSGNGFDFILIIRGEYTPSKAIDYLRQMNPSAKIILYMWDSIRNNRGIEKKWKLFDRVYTFDRLDYLNHQTEIGFVPLYYREEDIEDLDLSQSPLYDIAFVGTAHGDRVKIVNEIESECKKNGLKMYKYLYSPHVLVYIYNKLFNKDYRHVKKKDLSFQMIPQKKIYEIYCKSRCVLDAEIKTQTGLTMRTIDILGLKRKLITTNKDIVNYDFYNPNNICIIDRKHISLDCNFLEKTYQEIDGEIYKKYSMKSWLISLLELH